MVSSLLHLLHIPQFTLVSILTHLNSAVLDPSCDVVWFRKNWTPIIYMNNCSPFFPKSDIVTRRFPWSYGMTISVICICMKVPYAPSYQPIIYRSVRILILLNGLYVHCVTLSVFGKIGHQLYIWKIGVQFFPYLTTSHDGYNTVVIFSYYFLLHLFEPNRDTISIRTTYITLFICICRYINRYIVKIRKRPII